MAHRNSEKKALHVASVVPLSVLGWFGLSGSVDDATSAKIRQAQYERVLPYLSKGNFGLMGGFGESLATGQKTMPLHELAGQGALPSPLAGVIDTKIENRTALGDGQSDPHRGLRLVPSGNVRRHHADREEEHGRGTNRTKTRKRLAGGRG